MSSCSKIVLILSKQDALLSILLDRPCSWLCTEVSHLVHASRATLAPTSHVNKFEASSDLSSLEIFQLILQNSASVNFAIRQLQGFQY